VLRGKSRPILDVDFCQRVLTRTAPNDVTKDRDSVGARAATVAKEYQGEARHLDPSTFDVLAEAGDSNCLLLLMRTVPKRRASVCVSQSGVSPIRWTVNCFRERHWTAPEGG